MSIRFEKLQNGLWRAFDYRSGLSGLYNPDGTFRGGSLRLTLSFVLSKIK